MNYYRFDKTFCKEFATDAEALEEAVGYHDDRAATIEKWINNDWRPAADPVYQPWAFELALDGGWMMGENALVAFDSV